MVSNHRDIFAVAIVETVVFGFMLLLVHVDGWLRAPATTYGSAHFASKGEIKRSGFIAGPGSLILGRLSRRHLVGIPPERQYEHCLLIAPTGRGKSAGVIIPNLLIETGERGIFVNDIKRELYKKCAGALSQHMPVLLFAPTQPTDSIHYNPLTHIKSMEDAEDLASAWVDNTGLSHAYFDNSARLLITAATLHVIDTEPEAPFSQLADLLSSTTFDQIRQILSKSKSDRARNIASAFISSVGADAQLAGGLMSGMATRFLILKNPVIRKLTSSHPDAEHNLDFARLAQTPEALFLSVPASDVRRLKPLTALLTMQLMNHLAKAQRSKPFVLYLDELANSGKIPHYPEYISLIRGQQMAAVQAIQNFSQLNAVYGKEDAQTIIANSSTKIFYAGMAKPECEYVSQLLGVMTITVKSSGVTTKDGRGFLPEKSYQTQERDAERDLMTPDEVRQLGSNRLIVVSGNYPPMLIRSAPYYQQPALIELAELPIQAPTGQP